MARNGAAKKAPEKSTGKVVTREGTLDLPVSLTEKEDLARRKDLDKARLEILRLKDEAKGLRAEIRECETERDRLIKVVNDKAELRPTRVRKEIDFGANEVRIIRLDTGVVHEKRKPTAEERQGDIEDRIPPRTGGNGVTDKPPAGEKGKKLVGATKANDVEKPPRHPDREPAADNEIPF